MKRPIQYYASGMEDGTGAFSLAEIIEANRRHDRDYGFSFEDTHAYTNVRRLPETVFDDFYEHMGKQHAQEQEQHEQKINGANGFSEAVGTALPEP